PACLPTNRFHKKAVDVPIVCALVGEPLHIRELNLLPQRLVKTRQFAFVLSIEIRDVKIVEVFEIVGEISHLAAGEIEIDAANPARAGSHLRDRFRKNIDAEEMKLAFDAGFEI